MLRFTVLFLLGTAVMVLGAVQDRHTAIALGGYVLGLAFAGLTVHRQDAAP